MSAAARAFAGYFAQIVTLPEWQVIIGFVLVLTLISYRGIAESAIANVVCTAIELGGLMMILGFGFWNFSEVAPLDYTVATTSWSIFIGASLAFYAFMGFEDLANVAEESKNPERDLPMAILGSLFFAGLVYIAIAFIATHYVSPSQLAEAKAPLVDLAQQVKVPITRGYSRLSRCLQLPIPHF